MSNYSQTADISGGGYAGGWGGHGFGGGGVLESNRGGVLLLSGRSARNSRGHDQPDT